MTSIAHSLCSFKYDILPYILRSLFLDTFLLMPIALVFLLMALNPTSLFLPFFDKPMSSIRSTLFFFFLLLMAPVGFRETLDGWPLPVSSTG